MPNGCIISFASIKAHKDKVHKFNQQNLKLNFAHQHQQYSHQNQQNIYQRQYIHKYQNKYAFQNKNQIKQYYKQNHIEMFQEPNHNQNHYQKMKNHIKNTQYQVKVPQYQVKHFYNQKGKIKQPNTPYIHHQEVKGSPREALKNISFAHFHKKNGSKMPIQHQSQLKKASSQIFKPLLSKHSQENMPTFKEAKTSSKVMPTFKPFNAIKKALKYSGSQSSNRKCNSGVPLSLKREQNLEYQQKCINVFSEHSIVNSINLSQTSTDSIFQNSSSSNMQLSNNYEDKCGDTQKYIKRDAFSTVRQFKQQLKNIDYGMKSKVECRQQMMISKSQRLQKMAGYMIESVQNEVGLNFSKRQLQSFGRLLRQNDFQLIQEIGEGKYGRVYLSRHKETGFICALKILNKNKILEENIEEALIQEIKIQLYINHPNIVKMYGYFYNNENIFLILEYCTNGHLLRNINKYYNQNYLLQTITSLLQAVMFLHCHRIIHRDIKPQNIVIEHGISKLCDFGWAAYSAGDSRTTFCGTPLYVSPQLLKGEQYDFKTDIWALGVIAYEMVYNRVPFLIKNQAQMTKILTDQVYFPKNAHVSKELKQMLEKMLVKDPMHRASLNQLLTTGIIRKYLDSCKKSLLNFPI